MGPIFAPITDSAADTQTQTLQFHGPEGSGHWQEPLCPLHPPPTLGEWPLHTQVLSPAWQDPSVSLSPLGCPVKRVAPFTSTPDLT
jgi:hypothetical protein